MSGTRGIRLFAIAVLSLSSLLVAAPHRAAAQDADARRDEVRQEIPVELARRIDDAVDRGVAFLSKRQGEDGGWSLGRSLDGTRIFDAPGGRLMFEGALGRTARAAEALLDAGVPASDPRITRAAAWIEAGMDRLDRAPPPAICPVEYASSVLRLRLRLGLLDERSRALRDGILRTRAGDGTFLGAGDHPSNLVPYGWCSSTCDAMSALALARVSGLEVDEEVGRRLRRALAAGQARDGGWSRHPSYRPKGPEVLSAQARPTFGGTTTSLAAYLLADRSDASPEARRTDPVVARGLAWLARGFDGPRGVWVGPAGGVRLVYSERFFADLLALAMVGESLGIREWDGFRWYERGAGQLLSIQRKTGEWIHLGRDGAGRPEGISSETLDDNTALAVSFLARGRGRRAGSETPGGAAVATGTGFADFDWKAAEGLDAPGKAELFAAAFPRFLALDEREWPTSAGRFAALGTEVLTLLVDRLGSEAALDRRGALAALDALVGETLEFDPAADEEERRAGIVAWRRWLAVVAPSLERDGSAFRAKVPAAPQPPR